MKDDLEKKLDDFFSKNPIAKGGLHKLENIEHIEKSLKLKLNKSYQEFILKYGGSIVKSIEVYGIFNSELMDEVDIIELNRSFKEGSKDINNWFIIGSDYCGNPIGINEKGEVLCNDFDMGGVYIIANSFENYLDECLSEND